MNGKTTQWIKARASNGSGACVEMRTINGLVEVRDSKQGTTGPILSFTNAEWSAWLDAAKNGEFDQLG